MIKVKEDAVEHFHKPRIYRKIVNWIELFNEQFGKDVFWK